MEEGANGDGGGGDDDDDDEGFVARVAGARLPTSLALAGCIVFLAGVGHCEAVRPGVER